MSTQYDVVEVYVCPTCDESFEILGGPVYECSRCGSTEVVEEGERGRCSACNVFMAKLAPCSCPECEDPFENEPELQERVQTPDGETHANMTAARRWMKSAPQRAKAAAENAAREKERHERYRQESARKRAHRQAVVARWKPIEYYGGKNDDSMFWDSSTIVLTAAELLDLTDAGDDLIEAIRRATVHQDAYLAEDQPRQSFVLPNLKYLEYDDDGFEERHLRAQTQFSFDFEIFERLVDARVGNSPKV